MITLSEMVVLTSPSQKSANVEEQNTSDWKFVVSKTYSHAISKTPPRMEILLP